MIFDARYSWQPIETAPDLDRVMVCGWQPRHGTCAGYWWWGEDATTESGASENPNALFWAPMVMPPFPESPTGCAQ